MHPDIEEILDAIAKDKTNGATWLAGRGLHALEILAGTLTDDADRARAAIAHLIRRIDEVRPSMGAIGVQAALAATRAHTLVDQGALWGNALSRAVSLEQEAMSQADSSIAHLAVQEIGTGAVVVSCSSSATVERALVALTPDLVRIGEGHPLGDGIRAATRLKERGIEVEVVPDGALAGAVNGAKAVLIGADQVLANGSVVNRCSSFTLALSARYHNLPFFVACQQIKLTGRTEALIEEDHRQLHELPQGIRSRVPIFDVTPAELVHKILTEKGPMTPSEAGKAGGDAKHMMNMLFMAG